MYCLTAICDESDPFLYTQYIHHNISLTHTQTQTRKFESHTVQLETYQNAIELMGFKVTKKSLVYIGPSINIVNL